MTADSKSPLQTPKPLKSVAEIRRVLKSIHNANQQIPPGPYFHGLPVVELPAIRASWTKPKEIIASARILVKDAEYYRCLLLKKSAEVGAVAGGFLGANIGCSIPILMGNNAAIPLATLLGLVIGGAVGVVVAQAVVTRRRFDLFGRVRLS